jgi:molybdopterin molybdotransferase
MTALHTPPRSPLLSIDAARATIIAGLRAIDGEESLPLAQSRGRVLARDLVSPRALPVFDHSAMDGYALALSPAVESYRLVGRIAAGAPSGAALKPGEAVRIFTGAPLPSGADAVAMQENVVASGADVRLTRDVIAGDNIRHAGEDVALGAPLVAAGVVIDARHIGLAAAVGMSTLPVRRKLRVALVSTGDELVDVGGTLAPGLIYDCNRPMLAAALERPALEIQDFGVLPDNRAAITAFFAKAAPKFDLVITTGGASVGDEDHLAAALAAAGGSIDVARVAIRPGKPFTHGRIGAASVAILPGNPFAAFVAALLFVRPMVERALGLPVPAFAPLPARAGFSQTRPRDRVEFMPARVISRGENGAPVIDRLGRGGSARLHPLIAADGLAVVAPGDAPLCVGDTVGYLPFGAAFSL